MADEGIRRLRVTIGNAEYNLRGEASETHLRTVARTVDDLMRGIASGNPRLDERRAAVLTALNLADQLIRIQSEHVTLRAQQETLQSKYAELLALLDEQTQTRDKSSSDDE